MIGRIVLTAALATAFGAPARAAGPTVVELFQSQGCSSCPPANSNVNRLAARADILALSFGVTYWDGGGWKDTFASPRNTARQWDYARARKRGRVWTPQVYINGRTDIVGRERAPLEASIASAGQPAGATVSVAGGRVSVAAGSAPKDGAQVWLVRYDPRIVEVPIRAGENNGRTLPHRNVVRELVPLGRWMGSAASFALPPAKQSGLVTAALVQAGPGGPILGAARG